MLKWNTLVAMMKTFELVHLLARLCGPATL